MSIPRDPVTRARGRKAQRRRADTKARDQVTGPPANVWQPKGPPPAPSSRRLLSRADLRAGGIRFHPNYLRRLWEAGKFPTPVKLTPGRLSWWEHEVIEWMSEKAKAMVVGDA